MSDAALDLMRELACEAGTNETFADHFAELANFAAQKGDDAMADAMLRHGRLHRVRAIELRARFGALIAASGSRGSASL